MVKWRVRAYLLLQEITATQTDTVTHPDDIAAQVAHSKPTRRAIQHAVGHDADHLPVP